MQCCNLKQDYKDCVCDCVQNRKQNVYDSQMWELPWKIYLYQFFKREKLTNESTDNVVCMQWQSTDKQH